MTITPDVDGRLLLPVGEVRHKLGGIGWTKYCELCNSGALERVNIGRRSFVTAESLHAYVQRLRDTAKADA